MKRRRLRSWLTIIGILASVAIIFILFSLSLGLESAVEEQFRLLGSDKFFVYAKLQAGIPGENNPIQITTDDVDIIKRATGVKAVTYFNLGNGEIDFKDKTRYHMVLGMPVNSQDEINIMFESANLGMDEGKLLSKGDSGVIMVGYDFRHKNLFDKPVRAGNTLEINGVSFKVKGIVQQIGNPQDDRQLYMPMDDFEILFDSGNRADSIVAQIQAGADMEDVTEKVEKKLRNSRDQTEKTQDFSVVTPQEFLAAFKDILNVITAFLLAVAAISVIVGGIGIANTMYTSVLERTKEIGVMKAVGARNSDILKLFLFESGLLGLVGGIIGVVLGIIVSKSVEYVAVNQLGTNLLRAAMPIPLIIGCLVFAFLAGAISGTFPAWRASKVVPVKALRYE